MKLLCRVDGAGRRNGGFTMLNPASNVAVKFDRCKSTSKIPERKIPFKGSAGTLVVSYVIESRKKSEDFFNENAFI